MKRVSANKDIVSSIENALAQIEKQQEHDKEKVGKAVQRLEKHGGVNLHLGDHFEIAQKDFNIIGSPSGSKKMMIGEAMPSLKGDMYIIGRDVGHKKGQVVGDLVYYKFNNSQVSKREGGEKAPKSFSRFQLALIPNGDRVEIFNIGGKKVDLYFEGEVEF
jgi:hypothetical protein